MVPGLLDRFWQSIECFWEVTFEEVVFPWKDEGFDVVQSLHCIVQRGCLEQHVGKHLRSLAHGFDFELVRLQGNNFVSQHEEADYLLIHRCQHVLERLRCVHAVLQRVGIAARGGLYAIGVI